RRRDRDLLHPGHAGDGRAPGRATAARRRHAPLAARARRRGDRAFAVRRGDEGRDRAERMRRPAVAGLWSVRRAKARSYLMRSVPASLGGSLRRRSANTSKHLREAWCPYPCPRAVAALFELEVEIE